MNENILFEKILLRETMSEKTAAKKYLKSIKLYPDSRKRSCMYAFLAGNLLYSEDELYTEIQINRKEDINRHIVIYASEVGIYFESGKGKDLPFDEAVIKAFFDGYETAEYMDIGSELNRRGYTRIVAH